MRARQLAVLDARCDPGTRKLAQMFAAHLHGLQPMSRLPLASLAFPALRRRPRPQLGTLINTMCELSTPTDASRSMNTVSPH